MKLDMNLNARRNFIYLATYFLLSSVLLFSDVVNAQESTTIVLSVGQIKTIKVGTVVRIAVGRDDLVNVSATENGEIVLLPKSPGESDVVIWKEGGRLLKYRVNILPNDMTARKSAIDLLLKSYPGISTRIAGDKIVVEGNVDPGAIDGLRSIIDDLPNTVGILTPVFTTRDMINIKLTVLEIDKNYSRDIGIDFADAAEGPTLALLNNFSPNVLFNNLGQGAGLFDDALARLPLDSNAPLTFGGIASTLTSTINLIEENGGGRILAEPVLSARSGEQANFFAGGEVPFQTIGPLGQPTIDFFDFGIILEIMAVSDSEGNILAKIDAEVSSVDGSVVVAGVPGKLVRQTESTINVHDGDTFAISGLVLSTDSRTVDQLPFLGNIPVLGHLFRSKAFQEQRTELVILVTPTIVDSDDSHIYNKELREIKTEMESILDGDSVLQRQLRR